MPETRRRHAAAPQCTCGCLVDIRPRAQVHMLRACAVWSAGRRCGRSKAERARALRSQSASAASNIIMAQTCPVPTLTCPRAQVNIIATGNYNFFNLLTLALCVPLLTMPACPCAPRPGCCPAARQRAPPLRQRAPRRARRLGTRATTGCRGDQAWPFTVAAVAARCVAAGLGGRPRAGCIRERPHGAHSLLLGELLL